MAEEFKIRLATIDDMKNVFELSNEDSVRKTSIIQKKILWDEHIEWFNKRLTDKKSKFFIIETLSGDFLGQVRFEQKDELIASISIIPNYQNKGLGFKILKKCTEASNFDHIIAYIKNSNISSLKIFQKVGYTFLTKDENFTKMIYKKNNTITDRVFIIAEMSANHCGDIELAKKIIKSAKECGADAIKLQTYTADTMTIDCKNDDFLIKNENSLWKGENLYELYQKAYTPWQWQGELKKYADEIGIELFSTPFDRTAVDFLESINIPKYKIAAFEAIDYPLIKYVASKMKPVIISTGISSFEEIQEAIDTCKSVGNNDITILKCTSAYPAKLEDMNLITIKDMYEKFAPQGVKIGLSDHTMNIETSIVAVALGAKVIEKHFTLDRKMGGADCAFSLNPDELKSLVNAIRNTEKVLGKVNYNVNEQNRKFARSLYVVKDIKKGEKFTYENIRSIRPSNGLHPKYYDEIIGKIASCDLKLGTPLKKECYNV